MAMKFPRDIVPRRRLLLDTATSLGLVLAMSISLSGCDIGANPVLIPPGSIEGVEDALGGTDHFRQLCLSPLKIRLSSDSPVLAVVNTVDFQPRFGVLVTDPIEKRVFEFSVDGKLKHTFGRPGNGPGEFRDLADAVFVEGRRIVALDGVEGLSLFDSAGSLLQAPLGPTVFGGTQLGHLTKRSLIVGIGAGVLRPDSMSNMVEIIDLDSGRVRRSFASVNWRTVQSVQLFRGVLVGADLSGSVVAVSVPYRLGLDFYSADGQLLGSWNGSANAFRTPQPHPQLFSSRLDSDTWILASSYLFATSVIDTDKALLAWSSYDNRKRHYTVAVHSVVRSGLISVDEVPYRFLRGMGDTLIFLNASLAPDYELEICRGWLPVVRQRAVRGTRAN
jgi:hypothetical protein